MRETFQIAAVASAALLAGCLGNGERTLHETYSTPVCAVSHTNGVWDAEYGRTAEPGNCSFSFRVVRYTDGFGVKATVLDDVVVADDCKPGSVSCPSWDDDTLQCFFDGDNDKSPDSRAGNGLFYGGEYTLVANGAAQSDFSGHPESFGGLWKGTVDRVDLQDGGVKLYYDLWFAWECIGRRVPPAPDEDVTFGFNICVHDDDDGGRCDRALYWKGTPVMPYRDESTFGTITLKGRKTE